MLCGVCEIRVIFLSFIYTLWSPKAHCSPTDLVYPFCDGVVLVASCSHSIISLRKRCIRKSCVARLSHPEVAVVVRMAFLWMRVGNSAVPEPSHRKLPLYQIHEQTQERRLDTVNINEPKKKRTQVASHRNFKLT